MTAARLASFGPAVSITLSVSPAACFRRAGRRGTVAPLGLREVECPVVGLVGLAVAAGATQELGAGGVVVPVVLQVEDGQPGLGPADLGHGDGPVHLDDRGTGLPGERLVQRGDLQPVARLLQVQVGDCGLEMTATGPEQVEFMRSVGQSRPRTRRTRRGDQALRIPAIRLGARRRWLAPAGGPSLLASGP